MPSLLEKCEHFLWLLRASDTLLKLQLKKKCEEDQDLPDVWRRMPILVKSKTF
jgi:hypothetical protein